MIVVIYMREITGRRTKKREHNVFLFGSYVLYSVITDIVRVDRNIGVLYLEAKHGVPSERIELM